MPDIIQPVETGSVQITGAKTGQVSRFEPTERGTLRADPRLEYVSGGSYSYTASYLRSLPFHIDDITASFGDDLYERMVLDAQVASCVHTLKMGALSQGIQLVPAKKPGEDGHEKAEEIAAFCRRVLDDLSTPLLPALYDMLDAIALGSRAAELIYEYAESGEDKGKLLLRAVKPKPRRSVAYVVDAYTNLVGLLGLVPGQGSPVLVNSLIGDPGQQPNLLPRRKFAVLTFRPRNSDPRGQSLLRPAYNCWNLKMQTWGDYNKYLVQFASPSLVGTTAPNAVADVARDPLGNVLYDSNNLPMSLSPEQAMMSSLLAFQGGTALVVPNGAEVNPLQMSGDGGAFLSAFALFDAQISKAILCQTLATGEAAHMARAASETHQDVLQLVIASIKHSVATMIERDMLRPQVEMNFGLECLSLCPNVSLSDTAAEDFASNATAVAALTTANYFAPSQLPAVDARLSLPIRTAEDMEARDAQKQQAANALMPQNDAQGHGDKPDATDVTGDADKAAGNAAGA